MEGLVVVVVVILEGGFVAMLEEDVVTMLEGGFAVMLEGRVVTMLGVEVLRLIERVDVLELLMFV